MKKATSKTHLIKDEDMRPEYDFKGAVRGRHYKPLHEGYTVHVLQSDASTIIEQYTLAEGTVLLEPDVREYFPDSESVNAALRSLINLMADLPHKRKTTSKKRTA